MQDIHIPVKWIAFWRRLRETQERSGGGGGLWMTVEMGDFFIYFFLPRNKRKETIDTSLASLL